MTTHIDTCESQFLQGQEYTESDLHEAYMAEIENFDPEVWELPARAARLSAAVKRFKTSQMIRFLLKVAREEELDITPVVAGKLGIKLFNRKGSYKVLSGTFSIKGRTERSSTNDEEQLTLISIKYQYEANNYWLESSMTIDKIKAEYQAAIGEKNKAFDEQVRDRDH